MSDGANQQPRSTITVTKTSRTVTTTPSTITATHSATPSTYTGRPAPRVPAQVTSVPAASGNPITFSTGSTLLESDLAARGQGVAGRGAFNIDRITIAAAGVDAAVASAIVGSDGRMPDPPALDVVAWYDFSQWPGLGGLPGAGGNVVLAGDAIKPAGSGVFTTLSRVNVGAFVRLALSDGSTACYRIEFVKFAAPEQFDSLVQATADESVTLITGGMADNRAVLWGRRANCDAEPASTSTPSPPAGHHKLKIVAEGLVFTIVEGGTVPLGTHTVDVTIDHRDAGVQHAIAFFDATGLPINSSEPVTGPVADWGSSFGVGPPQPPGQYTFRCSIHPQMTGTVTVLP